MSRPDELVAGRYRLVRRVASGGMGTVWEAWDERLHRTVALKQLDPQPGVSAEEAHLATQRAMREARITARLHHPNAVPIYDAVDHEDRPCLVMPFLPSPTLQQQLSERGGPLGVGEVAQIGRQVADALAAAHAAGIVHRDVKPGNIIIDTDGTAKITDFGIAHARGDSSVTSTGMVTGTPAYLAPEVARGDDSGPASDVFSLGSTLYAAVEGMPPFGMDGNPMATLHRVASLEITPPRRAGALTPVLVQLLARDPRARPSMADTARMLAQVAADPHSSARTERFAPAPPLPNRTVALPPDPGPVPMPPMRPPRPAARPVAPVPVGAPPEQPRRRGGIGWLVALIVVALLVVGGIVLASQLGGSDGGTGAAGPTSGVSGQPSTTPKASKSTSPSRSKASDTPPPTEQSTPSSPDSSSSSSSSSSAGGGTPSSGQAKKAVREYYGLLPGDTDAGWSRLTADYQQQTGGRDAYDQFWGEFSAVSATDVKSGGDGQVTATITYTRKAGGKSSEQRSFTIVTEDGVDKIAASSVTG